MKELITHYLFKMSPQIIRKYQYKKEKRKISKDQVCQKNLFPKKYQDRGQDRKGKESKKVRNQFLQREKKIKKVKRKRKKGKKKTMKSRKKKKIGANLKENTAKNNSFKQRKTKNYQ